MMRERPEDIHGGPERDGGQDLSRLALQRVGIHWFDTRLGRSHGRLLDAGTAANARPAEPRNASSARRRRYTEFTDRKRFRNDTLLAFPQVQRAFHTFAARNALV